MQINTTIATNGRGLWSNSSTSVYCTDASIAYCNEESDWAELRVYFDTSTWDIDSLGLVYTDPGFLKNIKRLFTAAGINVEDLGYSEQGMQGDDYVSLDAGPLFIAAWRAAGHGVL
jgi:hypothetical protein